jgi:hypothetical protein
MRKSKKLRQLRIKRKLKKAKKVEEQIKKDPYADIDSEFCGISKNHQLVQDFCRALKNKKVFGLFRMRYSIKDVPPGQKRSALRDNSPIYLKGITLYNMRNDSDLIKRLKILCRMIYINNYDVKKWEKLNYRSSITNFLSFYAEDYLSKKSYPIKHSLLYYQFLFGIGSTVVGLVLMFCLIYYMWGCSVLITMLGLLLVYCAGVTIKIYKN